MEKKELDNDVCMYYYGNINIKLLETVDELSKTLEHKPNIIDSGPINVTPGMLVRPISNG